jgi:hypothetical protein
VAALGAAVLGQRRLKARAEQVLANAATGLDAGVRL